VGFTGRDAEFCTSLHHQYKKYGRLTEKQMVYLKKIIPKYWKQVVNESKTAGRYEQLLQIAGGKANCTA